MEAVKNKATQKNKPKKQISALGAKLREIRKKIEKANYPLLTLNQIQREVKERR